MEVWKCSFPECQQEFQRYLSQVRNPDRVYCSPAHRGKHFHQLGIQRGERNSNYRHGRHSDDSICECGRIKDYRAKVCAICAKGSTPVGTDRPLPDSVFLLRTDGKRSRRPARWLRQYEPETYFCKECGLKDWRGQSLMLELHHVNGNRCDDRRDNLMWLCPNCHQQTDNYKGRNKAYV